MLTGTIRINGINWGYASAEAPVEAFWAPEERTKKLRGGRIIEIEKLWRMRGRFGFNGLSGVDLAQLKGLTAKPFSVTLRTRRAGDPAWGELTALVRRRNHIPETGPLYRRTIRGVVYEDVIEFEAFEALEQVPGRLDGGFEYRGSHEVGGPPYGPWQAHDIAAWGEATITEREVTVTVWDEDGTPEELTLTLYDLGPDVLVDLVTQPDPLDELSFLLDVSGAYHLGTPITETEQ